MNMNEDLLIKKILSLEEMVKNIKEELATKADIRELQFGQDRVLLLLQQFIQQWNKRCALVNKKMTGTDEDIELLTYM